MNPYHFVVFNESADYRALARQRDKEIRGLLVVHKDSPIRSLEDLSCAEVAFPAPAAFAATIITSAHLRMKTLLLYRATSILMTLCTLQYNGAFSMLGVALSVRLTVHLTTLNKNYVSFGRAKVIRLMLLRPIQIWHSLTDKLFLMHYLLCLMTQVSLGF